MSKPKIIAFYLPQFHPTPDNDKWWGKGFTEWTNVAKAKPLFKGHYQPHIPADLGFYDLRVPEVREQQAELAREAGIYGFCYYHYWFGGGKQELELPLNEVLKSGKPDFPFMLCWANESWHKKFWDKDGKGSSKEMLIEQTYSPEDYELHFNHVLPIFKDPRYIRIDDKPVFMIYRPMDVPDLKVFTTLWQEKAKENGLKGIYFIGQIKTTNYKGIKEEDWIRMLQADGLSGINTVRLYDAAVKDNNRSFFHKVESKISRSIFKQPIRVKYKDIMLSLVSEIDQSVGIYPTIIPNWDHTPRSGRNGLVYENCFPEYFKVHVEKVLDCVKGKDEDNNIVFLKSWNEWGEGNYMEPDMRYGKSYLNILKEALTKNGRD